MIRQVAAILMLLAFGAVAAVAADDIVGNWETSQGPMQIVLQGDDTYVLVFAQFPGIVTGQLDAKGRLVGSWFREAGPGACATASNGTSHWGRFGLQFSPERGFAGAWTYCDARPGTINFTGSRHQ